ncbi:MAG: PPOX class F420-dependent oxidoreductase [Pseudomonadota bacterium]
MSITLENAQYLNLATFRKNGNAVKTPIWFAQIGEAYYAFSAGNAGKVKRLRNSSKSRVAPCDARGKVLGEWIDSEALIILDTDEIEQAYQALRQKYGWQMRLLDFFSHLAGKIKQRSVIAIKLQP